MKTRYYLTFLMAFFAAIVFSGCKKDFLERLPQSAITSKDFFKTVADMETYSNVFY